MSKNGKKDYFRGDEWFRQKVHLRVKESLEKQERQFAEDHKHDSNEQLLTYLREFTAKLGHTPNPSEIIGGQYIFHRFGDWDTAVDAAGLRRPGKKAQLSNRMIYKEEYKRQVVLFQQERKENREERKVHRQEASQQALEAQRDREARDKAWGQKHSYYTQEQLSQYLRKCAGDLGHTPFMKEVVGGCYIAKRFGSWPLALTVARLPLPQGMTPGKEGYRQIPKDFEGICCKAGKYSAGSGLDRR